MSHCYTNSLLHLTVFSLHFSLPLGSREDSLREIQRLGLDFELF